MWTVARSSLLSVLLITTPGCALQDLRPESMVGDTLPDDAPERGRRLVSQMASAHGLEAWRDVEQMRIVYDDRWPSGPMRRFGTPLRDETTRVELTFTPGSGFVSEARFLDGRRQSEGAGMDGSRAYALRDGERRTKGSMAYEVYVPATQYLFELPFRLHEDADTWVHLGSSEQDGQPVEIVLVTWGGTEPRKDADQYVLYIHRDSHLLLRSDYTIRAGGKPFSSTIWFSDHRDVDGITMAFGSRVDQLTPFPVRPLHEATVHRVETSPATMALPIRSAP